MEKGISTRSNLNAFCLEKLSGRALVIKNGFCRREIKKGINVGSSTTKYHPVAEFPSLPEGAASSFATGVPVALPPIIPQQGGGVPQKVKVIQSRLLFGRKFSIFYTLKTKFFAKINSNKTFQKEKNMQEPNSFLTSALVVPDNGLLFILYDLKLRRAVVRRTAMTVKGHKGCLEMLGAVLGLTGKAPTR